MKVKGNGISKWLAIFLLISMGIALSACTIGEKIINPTHTPVPTRTPTQEPEDITVTPKITDEPTATIGPTQTPTATPNTSPGADVSTYAEYYGKKIVVLTFDDGPHWQNTDKLLDGLKERGVKATFFVTAIGSSDWDWNIDKKILNRMVQEGHEIGNHTQHHKKLTKLTEEEVKRELSTVSDRVKEMTGYEIKLFRPPAGDFNKQVVNAANLALVYWTLDTNDWRYLNDNYLKDYAEKNSISIEEAKKQNVKFLLDALTGKIPNNDIFTGELKHGSILLMHDLYEGTVDLALSLIDELSKEDYVFLPLSEAIMTVGAAPVAGDAYKSIWEGYKISVK